MLAARLAGRYDATTEVRTRTATAAPNAIGPKGLTRNSSELDRGPGEGEAGEGAGRSRSEALGDVAPLDFAGGGAEREAYGDLAGTAAVRCARRP